MDKQEQRAKITLFRDAARRLVRDVQHTLVQAFETAGCSCKPLREELEKVKIEHADVTRREWKEVQKRIDCLPVTIRMKKLQEEVSSIDSREYPILEQQAEIARVFFRIWVFDQLVSGSISDIKNRREITTRYAQAWLSGWRPPSVEE